jgi:hypothetical protein
MKKENEKQKNKRLRNVKKGTRNRKRPFVMKTKSGVYK